MVIQTDTRIFVLYCSVSGMVRANSFYKCKGLSVQTVESGNEIEKKCTTGSYGEPFVSTSIVNSLVVPFSNVPNVKTVLLDFDYMRSTISWNSGQHAQISD